MRKQTDTQKGNDMSTYKFVGVSRLKGELKVRFANDAARVKVLAKNGHTDIDLIELTHPMTKEEAIGFLMSINFYEKDGVVNEEVHSALIEAVDRRAPATAANKERRGNKEAKKPKKDAAPKKTVKSEMTLETIAAKAPPKSTLSKKDIEKQLAGIEDAPF